MLGFRHPRPPSRKEVAMQVVQQERKTFSATSLTVDPPDQPVAAAPPSGLPIRFDVVYTAAEYRGFVRAQLDVLARRDSPGGRRAKLAWPIALALGAVLLAWQAGPGWLRALSMAGAALALACLPVMTGFWVALIAMPVFYMKKRRMPLCAFSIDAAGIERTSLAGRLVRRWDEVRSVRRCRHGYLISFARGAIPLPFRCMTAQQQERLRALILARDARALA